MTAGEGRVEFALPGPEVPRALAWCVLEWPLVTSSGPTIHIYGDVTTRERAERAVAELRSDPLRRPGSRYAVGYLAAAEDPR